MWFCREKTALQNMLSWNFKILVFLDFFFLKLKLFWKFWFSPMSLTFLKKKNGIYVLEPYTVHVHTKFQANISFGFHFIAQKRCWPPVGSMVPTYSNLSFGIRTASTSVYALESVLCGWFSLHLLHISLVCIFKYIWYFPLLIIDKKSYLSEKLIIYDVTSTNRYITRWKLQNTGLKPPAMSFFYKNYLKHVSHDYIHNYTKVDLCWPDLDLTFSLRFTCLTCIWVYIHYLPQHMNSDTKMT